MYAWNLCRCYVHELKMGEKKAWQVALKSKGQKEAIVEANYLILQFINFEIAQNIIALL